MSALSPKASKMKSKATSERQNGVLKSSQIENKQPAAGGEALQIIKNPHMQFRRNYIVTGFWNCSLTSETKFLDPHLDTN